MMFTGQIINAAEAEKYGIVSRVVPPDQLMPTALELATRIAAQPPLAIELTKRAVYRTMLDDIARHLDAESYGAMICSPSEDAKEAIRAFLEKRPQPKFKGK